MYKFQFRDTQKENTQLALKLKESQQLRSDQQNMIDIQHKKLTKYKSAIKKYQNEIKHW